MARPRGAKDKPKRPIDIGPPPDDPLAVLGEYVPKVARLMLHQVLTDPDLADRDRRREARVLMKTLVATAPAQRMLAAERKIREAEGKMEQTRADPPVLKDGDDAEPAEPLRIDNQ